MSNVDSREFRGSNVTPRGNGGKAAGGCAFAVTMLVIYFAFNLRPPSVPEIFLDKPQLDRIQQFALDANTGTPLGGDVTRLVVEVVGGRKVTFVYTLSRDLTNKEKETLMLPSGKRSLALKKVENEVGGSVNLWFQYRGPGGTVQVEFQQR